MSKIKKIIITILPLLLIISCINNGSANVEHNVENLANNKSNIIRNSLSAQKNDNTILSYNPNEAISACREFIPDGSNGRQFGIWPEDPTNQLPSPIPTADDCGEISSQIASGCGIQENNFGERLKNSVVKVFIPKKDGVYYDSPCTGTVIDQNWILTAGHCVAIVGDQHFNGYFRPGLYNSPVKVVLGQLGQINYKEVFSKAIYIPYDFNYYMEQFPTRPYPGYVKKDFALIKLEKPLPDYYTSIALSNKFLPTSGVLQPLWVAGYGVGATQVTDGQLHYRKQYYMTSLYDASWQGGVPGNYNMLYFLGSMPQDYNGKLSAWKFNGAGDSGAPLILEDQKNKKLYLEGINVGGLFCRYAGYFAQLPYPYSQATSIAANNQLINDIIHGNAARSKTRCISSKLGACTSNNAYVLNYNYGNIAIDSINPDTGMPNGLTRIYSGLNPLKIAFDDNGWFAYVINSGNDSISLYQITGRSLTSLAISHMYLPPGSNPVDIEFHNGYVYIVNYSLNSINIYKQEANGELVFVHLVATAANPLSINFDSSGSYAYLINGDAITIYSVSINGELIYKTDIPSNAPSMLRFSLYNHHEYVYAISKIHKTISVFKKAVNGDLILTNTLRLDFVPTDIIFSPNDTLVYISVYATNIIMVFDAMPNDTFEYLGSVASGINPSGMSIDSSGKYLLAANSGEETVSVYKILYQKPWLLETSKFNSGGYTPVMVTTLPK